MTFPLSHAAQADDTPVVRLSGVGVRFGTNVVLRDVSLDLFPGSITALLGTNGAGKSTLIGAISGANAGYTGEISVGGSTQRLGSPARARRAGIETVHQRIADGIVPGLSVADNLALTDFATGGHRLVRRAEAERVARAALERLGLSWSDEVLRADAARLGTSDAQLLVLARALRSTPRLLILDEPTSALTAAEADRLFAVLRVLRDEGLSILFVSHRFGEIERLADRIVVLRDGRLELEAARPFDWQAAQEAMLGVPTELQQHITEPLPAGAEVLSIAGAALLPGSEPLTLDVAAGQVTGILGLLGAGKTELAEIVAGVRPTGTARLRLDGRGRRDALGLAGVPGAVGDPGHGGAQLRRTRPVGRAAQRVQRTPRSAADPRLRRARHRADRAGARRARRQGQARRRREALLQRRDPQRRAAGRGRARQAEGDRIDRKSVV